MSQATTDLITTALITGGSSGIGKAIAQYLISKNKKVIIVGRTKSTLESTAKEIGAADYYTLDTGDIKSIDPFIAKVVKDHPDLNCLINNAGVQRPFQFPGSGGEDYSFDLSKADQEIDINIRGPMHLVVGLLPHFTSSSENNNNNNNEKKSSVIINVSSVLGFNPTSIINPVYNGTKAWMHFFTLNLRTQFETYGSNNNSNNSNNNNNKLKVVEIVPPQVATDLHRDRVDPDDNKVGKSKTTMSLEDFMKDVTEGLERGDDTVSAGVGKGLVDKWAGTMGEAYKKAVQ